MKQEVSGWPSWCTTEEHRHKYIQDYFDKEGILLDNSKIEKNPGLRSLAKLMLNSFGGNSDNEQIFHNSNTYPIRPYILIC